MLLYILDLVFHVDFYHHFCNTLYIHRFRFSRDHTDTQRDTKVTTMNLAAFNAETCLAENLGYLWKFIYFFTRLFLHKASTRLRLGCKLHCFRDRITFVTMGGTEMEYTSVVW